MNSVQKTLSSLLVLAGVAFTAMPVLGTAASVEDGLKATIKGAFDFRTAIVDQNKRKGSEKKVSKNHNDFAFDTRAAIMAQLENKVGDVTYGGRITLVPTNKSSGSPSYNGSHLFVESAFGKVELGSAFDAATTMMVSGYDVAAALGDAWSSYAKFDTASMTSKGIEPEFATTNDYFFGSLLASNLDQINDTTEQSRKITYYTPKYNGFQFGVSYIPDSANIGIAKAKEQGIKPSVVEIEALNEVWVIDQNVKDAFALGLSYEHNISDGVDLKVAATGEFAKAAGKAIKKTYSTDKEQNKDLEKNFVSSHKLSNLKTYHIGANLTYGSFSYGLSYGTLGKSLTTAEYHKNGRNTHYYNAGVGYAQGPLGVSLSYFKSEQYKNKLDAVTLGTDYKLMPGLKPYAEITYFTKKGRPAYLTDEPKKKTKGTIALIGAKLTF